MSTVMLPKPRFLQFDSAGFLLAMIPHQMTQTFFKVVAPHKALKILLSVAPVGKEQIASVKACGRRD